MIIGRYFKISVNNWEYRERDIPATYKEQRTFYKGELPPRCALPQASNDDIAFLLEGCCFDPTM